MHAVMRAAVPHVVLSAAKDLTALLRCEVLRRAQDDMRIRPPSTSEALEGRMRLRVDLADARAAGELLGGVGEIALLVAVDLGEVDLRELGRPTLVLLLGDLDVRELGVLGVE